jgi:hypothetical protein
MRAQTTGKHEMGRRFAIVIGAVAAGVMALGAQTVLAGGDRAPDLKLFGPKPQSLGIDCGDRCGPGAVQVIASCGEVNGPPVSSLKESPPANLPDLGCHVSAEGKVMGDKLRHGLQAHGVDLPGPHVQCEGGPAPPPHNCHWQSGSRALMVLELRKKTRKQVRKALTNGQKVWAEVTVEARKGGKVATAKRTIRLVK